MPIRTRPTGTHRRDRRTHQTDRWAGFQSIVCPVDFSEPSRLALRHAAAVAHRSHGRLTVIYANDPLLIAAAAAALHDRQIAKRSATELRKFVDETFVAGWPTVRVKTAVSIGSPSDEILRAAGRSRADLIVLGTHGLTGADRLFMGSTTLSVLQRTTVPVLAVPRTDGAAREGPGRSWPGPRILAALEIGPESQKEVATAACLAEWFGVPLLLAHAVDGGTAPSWVGSLSADDRIRVAKAQEQIDLLVGQARRRVQTDGRIVVGRVGDEIAALAASERAGLLVTALRDRRGWFGARRGSVSYHVLTLGVAPVLAYPQPWRLR